MFLLVCFALALGTALLYWPITHHPFIIFDDLQYIADNGHVNTGITWDNFVWAFTTGEQANWHPITWLSHQLDWTLFGTNAGGHHLINLLFHVANTLLLFLFLRRATGALWRSAFVAALFAWHPLHVESVAWAAERKDVLCAFFSLLTLLAYARYAAGEVSENGNESRQSVIRHSSLFYGLSLLCFALALMSKPMAVTLPFVSLLLDFWPLRRTHGSGFSLSTIKALAVEKIPFFTLALGSCIVTYLVQAHGGAVAGTSVADNLANAVLAYGGYIAKFFWPADLVVVYPHAAHWSMTLVLATAAVLVLWTFLCVRNWNKSPFLAVGWFWFMGALVPTVGLVQVGAASMADRYTYIPSIGFFIVVVWGAAGLFSATARAKVWLPVVGCLALLACAWTTSRQVACWRGSIPLFWHALEVTKDNYIAENCLGKSYEVAGDNAAALVCYRAAVAAEPRFPSSHFNLAMCLLTTGQRAEAIEYLQTAGALAPRDPNIQYNLGIYFAQQNQWTNAMNCFSNSLLTRPNYPAGQFALASALANVGAPAAARDHYREALRLKPNFPEAKTNLERLLKEHPELR
ncbi:MAG TPA: tetratricopeptide repeat protein [Verrucomicrobiae bacterium]